jgi:hypothetical protein
MYWASLLTPVCLPIDVIMQRVGLFYLCKPLISLLTSSSIGAKHEVSVQSALRLLRPADIESLCLKRVDEVALIDAIDVERSRLAAVVAPPPLPPRGNHVASPSSPTASTPTAATLRCIPFASLYPRGTLGRGSFGDVTLAWWEGGHTEVAVKANGVDCANAAAIDNERRLFEVLLLKPHRNIVTVFGICADAPDGGVRLVMNYSAFGSLDGMLRSQVRLECLQPL